MRVLLIQPPIGERTASVAPPVGIAALAAVLLEDGHEIRCLCSDAEGMDVADTIREAVSFAPGVVGISVATLAAPCAMMIARGVKAALDGDVRLVAGGTHATVMPEEMLAGGFDFVVRGEGERTFSSLLDVLKKGGDPGAVQGISASVPGGGFSHAPDRELIRDLDSLPTPAWELFPIHRFTSDFKKTGRSLPVLTSRGCTGRCSFCYKGVFGQRFRVRSPESVVKEICYLKERFGIEEFSILDDSFTSIPDRAIRICQLLVERDIGLPFSLPSGIRVDTVSRPLFEALRQAGCYRIGFGVETGDPEVMLRIKKKVTLDQVRRAVALAGEYGFTTACYFMIGNLGENEETVERSIRFALELDPDIVQFALATPYPGTQMYDELEAAGRIVSRDWSKYDGFAASGRIFEHPALCQERLRQLLRSAYRRFYLRPSYILRRLGGLRNPGDLAKLGRAFRKFLRIVISRGGDGGGEG